jgi:CoA:oxalate CoA-transferase
MGALDGIKVIDLSHVLAAPFATMIMADLGAEVIKVEPPFGDDSRQFGPFVEDEAGEQQSGYFISINRNKKSIVLNLKEEKGKEILRDLISDADVVVENYRPTTMKKLGFSYEEMKKIKEDIIYCSICGFGHDALEEYASKPAYDMVAQAYSGLMSITGPEGGEPCRVGSSIGDIMAGHQAVIGILSALRHRDRTGKGQHVDMSMVDGLVSVLENAIARYTMDGEIPGPLGGAHPTIVPFQSFKTKDSYIVTPIGNDSLWKKFCDALEMPELADDERFKTNPLRAENKDELIPILAKRIKEKNTADWEEIFEEYGLPYSPVNTVDKVVEDDNLRYRDMIVDLEQPGIGKVRVAGSPFHLSETPGEIKSHAPAKGEHTDSVLKESLGLTDAEIKEMKDKGIIG